MKIKSFNKQNLSQLRIEITEALKAVGEKNGLSLSLGTISFSADQFTTRLTVNTLMPQVAGVAAPTAAGAKSMFGLTIGQTFQSGSKLFTITKFNPSRPKNSVSFVDQNGKKFMGSPATIKMHIA
jgi:hypothetical protein